MADSRGISIYIFKKVRFNQSPDQRCAPNRNPMRIHKKSFKNFWIFGYLNLTTVFTVVKMKMYYFRKFKIELLVNYPKPNLQTPDDLNDFVFQYFHHLNLVNVQMEIFRRNSLQRTSGNALFLTAMTDCCGRISPFNVHGLWVHRNEQYEDVHCLFSFKLKRLIQIHWLNSLRCFTMNKKVGHLQSPQNFHHFWSEFLQFLHVVILYTFPRFNLNVYLWQQIKKFYSGFAAN